MLVIALDMEGLGVSGGSACSSGSTKPSHVLRALYGAEDDAVSVRFSYGLGTTEEDVDRAVAIAEAVVGRLRGG